MRSVLVVARQVVNEAARRRLLLALLLLTLVVIALTVWGVSRVDDLRDGGQPLSDAQKKTIVSQLLILVMFMFSWVLSLAAVFVAASSRSSSRTGLRQRPSRSSPSRRGAAINRRIRSSSSASSSEKAS